MARQPQPRRRATESDRTKVSEKISIQMSMLTAGVL